MEGGPPPTRPEAVFEAHLLHRRRQGPCLARCPPPMQLPSKLSSPNGACSGTATALLPQVFLSRGSQQTANAATRHFIQGYVSRFLQHWHIKTVIKNHDNNFVCSKECSSIPSREKSPVVSKSAPENQKGPSYHTAVQGPRQNRKRSPQRSTQVPTVCGPQAPTERATVREG